MCCLFDSPDEGSAANKRRSQLRRITPNDVDWAWEKWLKWVFLEGFIHGGSHVCQVTAHCSGQEVSHLVTLHTNSYDASVFEV